MISDELQQHWIQVACLTDISAVGKGPIAIRDHMVKLQIEKLFKNPCFETEDINDDRFWTSEPLRDKIQHAITSRQKEIKGLPPAVNALQAMSDSYRNAFPNKTFTG